MAKVAMMEKNLKIAKTVEKYAAKSYTLQPTLFSCPYV